MEAPPVAASAPVDSMRSARRPTIDDVWIAVAVAVPVLATLAAALRTVDLTYHLRVGREILTTAAIPAVDTWTATARGTA